MWNLLLPGDGHGWGFVEVMVNQKHKRKSEEGLTAAPSSSSMANSFFLTVFSWVLMLNSEACRSEVRGQRSEVKPATSSPSQLPRVLTFFCSFANLFSYLETFFRVGLMLGNQWGGQGTIDHLQFPSQVVDGNIELVDLNVKELFSSVDGLNTVFAKSTKKWH